ncbi:MAG: succinate dehydrogenase flavoprotein subunit, partial [Gammaproteobacteria bacterium]|nr:succinate dehydrogenase flavoprotein subunit [Gammaproteobacteria bacterium]
LHVEAQFLANELPELSYASDENIDVAMSRYRRWYDSKDGDSISQLRAEMQDIMQNDFGVFRSGDVMTEGLKRLAKLRDRLACAHLQDKSKIFNTEMIAALELDNLMATAYATAVCALTRTESRGAHSREDFPKRDDENWIKHTLYFAADDSTDHRPVNMSPKFIDPFEPKERVY